MKITKQNFNEMLNLIGEAVSTSEYNRECFSKSDVELNSIVWNEFAQICDELVKSNVNFDKFVLPILNHYGVHLNEDKLNKIRLTNTNDFIPEDLNIEIEVPYLENVNGWA